MVKIVYAGMSTVAVAAIGATVLTATMSTATLNVVPTAAIDDSGSTIGFSDPYLYGATDAQIDQQLDQMQALGVNNVRILIPWAGVEPIQGYYDWSSIDYTVNAANARGMGVLGVLNSSPAWAVSSGEPAISGAPASPAQYGDFAGLVAQRYAGKISAYEIWNEPNGQTYYAPKPDPAAYTELLKAAYPEIKAADPTATVIGGVTGAVVDYGDFTMNPVTFVQGIYAAGGEGYFDALSYHPYNYGTPFSQGAPLPDSPLNQLTAMRNLMVANGDASKEIWASEYGEPTSVATDDQQAAFIQDMLTTWPTLGYTGPTFIDTLNDVDTSSTNPEDTLGVIRSDGTLKPAAYVIQQLAAQRATTTPAMAQLALAMPGAAAADPADVATLTALAQTPDAAAVTPADAAAVAQLAVAPATTTPPAPTDPATVAATDMTAMADAVGKQLQASAAAAGTALQASAQAAAEGFQKQVASMATAATPTASATVSPAATSAQPVSSPAAIPSVTPNGLTSLAVAKPAASATTTASPANTATAAPTATAAASPSKTAPATAPKHQKAASAGSSSGAAGASASGSKPRHAKGD